jgi:hypothetical protein
MTPKEKAEQLFQLYLPFVQSGHIEEIKNRCKQCALIAVDEVILSRKDDSQFDDTLWAGGSDMYRMHPMYLNYWQEVKQEIENL